MQTNDRIIPSSATPKPADQRTLTAGQKGTLSATLRQKECLEQCLQLKRGFTSSEKNCILVCYQKSGLPRRKGLQI